MELRLRQDGLTWQEAGDDIVVLDLSGSVYLKLSGSGRLLWERLADGATEADLADLLVETYSIDHELAATDVAAFVSDLRTRELLLDG